MLLFIAKINNNRAIEDSTIKGAIIVLKMILRTIMTTSSSELDTANILIMVMDNHLASTTIKAHSSLKQI